MAEDDDLKNVMAEEKQRGRKRPIDIGARQMRMKLLNGFRVTLKTGDEAGFAELIINELGWQPGTKEYDAALKKWRALRGSS
ncbi:MAG: hypothetical protein ACYDCG_19285 [Candidatus Acidiferrales bacterium]